MKPREGNQILSALLVGGCELDSYSGDRFLIPIFHDREAGLLAQILDERRDRIERFRSISIGSDEVVAISEPKTVYIGRSSILVVSLSGILISGDRADLRSFLMSYVRKNNDNPAFSYQIVSIFGTQDEQASFLAKEKQRLSEAYGTESGDSFLFSALSSRFWLRAQKELDLNPGTEFFEKVRRRFFLYRSQDGGLMLDGFGDFPIDQRGKVEAIRSSLSAYYAEVIKAEAILNDEYYGVATQVAQREFIYQLPADMKQMPDQRMGVIDEFWDEESAAFWTKRGAKKYDRIARVIIVYLSGKIDWDMFTKLYKPVTSGEKRMMLLIERMHVEGKDQFNFGWTFNAGELIRTAYYDSFSLDRGNLLLSFADHFRGHEDLLDVLEGMLRNITSPSVAPYLGAVREKMQQKRR